MLSVIKVGELERHVLAGNGIEGEGQHRIAQLLRDAGIPSILMEKVEPVWTTKRGTYPKRLAKVLKANGYASTPALMGAIGQAAADNTSRQEEYWVRVDSSFTSEESGFPYEEGEHGDAGSCYHPGGQHDHAPYDIERTGGLLLRTFAPACGYGYLYHEGRYYRGSARCFILPCAFGVGWEEQTGIVMINAYCRDRESRDLLHLARLVATAEGLSYRKVIVNDVYGKIYVNNNSGYLIGEWDRIGSVESVDIRVEDADYSPEYRDRSYCEGCERRFDDDDLTTVGDDLYCPRCLERDFTRCDRCGGYVRVDYTTADDYTTAVGDEVWCDDCAESHAFRCAKCGGAFPDDDACEVDGDSWCGGCRDDHAAKCAECWDDFPTDDLQEVGGRDLCEECAGHTCRSCGVWEGFPVDVEGDPWCQECAERDAVVCAECGSYVRADSLITNGACFTCATRTERMAA